MNTWIFLGIMIAIISLTITDFRHDSRIKKLEKKDVVTCGYGDGK